MATTGSSHQLFGITSLKLSCAEKILLEAELFLFICNEIKDFFRTQYKNYFRLMKFSKEKGNHPV